MKRPNKTFAGRNGPLLIAEIGGNHEGSFEAALKLTDLAVESGADYVKFQIYRGDSLVSAFESPDRNAHFKRFELTREQHVALAERCLKQGAGYMASVWDLEMLDWIDPFLDKYKIGSGDLTAYPLIREFARRGKPIILSTGLSDLSEVLDAVAILQAENLSYRRADMLALLQCTSMYPIELGDANLAVMDSLREATGLSVGYSDHTVGSFALLIAAARGADVLEFHFTDGREGKSFRDHAVSLTCDEVKDFIRTLELLKATVGDGIKRPLPSEVHTGHVTSFRRGVYSKRALKKGEVVRAEDLLILRPNHGVDARKLEDALGRIVARDTAPYQALIVE